MKKIAVISLILAISLALGGCMGQGFLKTPEKTADGTPWDGAWVNMAGRVGVAQPGNGFELLTTNGTLEGMTIQYATWVCGRETEIDRNTYVYDGQIYLLTELCETEEQAAAAVDEWYGKLGEGVEITERLQIEVEGTAYELLCYRCTAPDSHFSRGTVCVFTHKDIVLVTDIAAVAELELDLTTVMEQFLGGIHYAD